MKVFDMYGNEVAVLADEYQAEGIYSRRFDPRKGANTITLGVYFYRLQTAEGTEMGKVVLVK